MIMALTDIKVKICAWNDREFIWVLNIRKRKLKHVNE